MSTSVNKINRYILLKEYGLEHFFDLNESLNAPQTQYREKFLSMVQRGIAILKRNGNEEKANELSSKANKEWSNGEDWPQKILGLCTALASLGLTDEELNYVIGREECDGSLYYVSRVNGKRMLMVKNRNNTGNSSSSTVGAIMAKNFISSDNGKKFTKKHEGLILRAYNDVTGHATIGYGHLKQKGERGLNAITKQQADTLFNNDLSKISTSVENKFRANNHGNNAKASFYPQAFIDMMLDVAFNAGPGGMAKSPIFKATSTLKTDQQTGRVDLDDLKRILPLFKKTAITSKGRVIKGLINRANDRYNYVIKNVYGA